MSPSVSQSMQTRRFDICSFKFWSSVYFFQELSQFSFNFNVCHSTHAETTYSTVPDFLTTENPQSMRALWKVLCYHWSKGNKSKSNFSMYNHLHTLSPKRLNKIFARLKKYGNATHKELNQTTKFLFISICCLVFETKSATKILVWYATHNDHCLQIFTVKAFHSPRCLLSYKHTARFVDCCLLLFEN